MEHNILSVYSIFSFGSYSVLYFHKRNRKFIVCQLYPHMCSKRYKKYIPTFWVWTSRREFSQLHLRSSHTYRHGRLEGWLLCTANPFWPWWILSQGTARTNRWAKSWTLTLESESVWRSSDFCLLISLIHLRKYNFYSFTSDQWFHTSSPLTLKDKFRASGYMTNTYYAKNCLSTLPVFLETNMCTWTLFPRGSFLKLWQDFRILDFGGRLRPSFVGVEGIVWRRLG